MVGVVKPYGQLKLFTLSSYPPSAMFLVRVFGHAVPVCVSSLCDSRCRDLLAALLWRCRGLLDIVASASEFNDLPVRQMEEKALKLLANHLPQKVVFLC